MPRPRRTTESSPAANFSTRRRCNALDGRRWLQNSISVWSDIRKSTDELRLKHPALFPAQLVERLVETFLPAGGQAILDPFCGTGTVLAVAERLGHRGVGCEISPDFAVVARDRISAARPDNSQPPRGTVYESSARALDQLLAPESIDLCVTSPPYWNILNQRRTADYKSVRHYGNLPDDLGVIADYEAFLSALTEVFSVVFTLLRPGAYCCVVVMDLRKRDRFFPFHSDLATRLTGVGYTLDDLIIWNRQAEYNNLRPLGYPSVFRVNKVHEFILLLQKRRVPADTTARRGM